MMKNTYLGISNTLQLSTIQSPDKGKKKKKMHHHENKQTEQVRENVKN